MRNRKAYFLVACILVVALMATLVIGCTPKTDGPNKGGSFSGGSIEDPFAGAEIVANADRYVQFELFAEKATDVEDRVNVVDLNGNKIDVAVRSLGSGVYKVYAPNGGYTMGSTYVIMLDDGVSFIDYSAKKVKFTITVDTLSNIEFNNGTVVIGSELTNSLKKEGNLTDGTEYGRIRVQNNGKFELAEGDVFVVDDKTTGLQQAYKVKTIDDVNGMYFIDYVKPNLEDVYSTFTYQGKEVLDEDNKEQILFKEEAEVVEELNNSPVAQMIGGIFGVAPKFDVDVQLVGNEVVAKIIITVADVVYTDNGSADLILSVEDHLSAIVNSNISNDKIKNKYDVAFDVNADIANTIVFNVGVVASGSYNKVENIQGLLDKVQVKLDEIKNQQELVEKIDQVNVQMENQDVANVKIFKWTLPIANGAAAISYDADLALNFGFSGDFGVSAQTTLNYKVGASYNMKDGIDTYAIADENNKPCDKVSVKLNGRVDTKIGINQRVGLDVLAGVLGIGLRANVGNFNRLYGYADASWIAAEEQNEDKTYDMLAEKAFDGTLYLEGGIYWDVNIDAGVKVGALIKLDALKDTNINKSFNVSTGEKILYTGGSKEIVRKISFQNPADGQGRALISSAKSTLNFNKLVYDVLTHKDNIPVALNGIDVQVSKVNDASAADYKLVQDDKGNWVVEIVSPGVDLEFAVNVKYDYKDCFGNDRTSENVIKYVYNASLAFKNDVNLYNKSNTNGNVIEIYAESAPQLFIEGQEVKAEDLTITNDGTLYILTINSRLLDNLSNGNKELTIKAGNETAKSILKIDGVVNVKNFLNEDGEYEIYCADQVIGLFALPFASTDTFAIVDNIDMNGAKLTTLPVFRASIHGYNHTISNYVIENTTSGVSVDGYNTVYAAVVAVNEGVIENLTFQGDVVLNDLKVAGNSNYYVAGVVGVNNNTLKNVNYQGNVTINSVGLQTATDVYVGAIVAKDNKTMTDCAVLADTTMTVNYKFDLLGMKFIVNDASNPNLTFAGKCTAGAYNNITKVVK